MTGNPSATPFRDFAEKNVAPAFIKAQKVTVNFLTEGCLIDTYSNVEYQAIKYLLGSVEIDFTQEEFQKYCRELVISRIRYVLGEKPSIKPMDHIIVPSFLMNMIMQIGFANDLKLGIAIEPASPPKDSPELAMEKVRAISLRLESLKEYEGGFGYPKDKSGSWDFMTMQLIDNVVQRHDATPHPVYAIMAAVLGPKLVQSVLSPLVMYGDTSLFEGMLWQLTSC